MVLRSLEIEDMIGRVFVSVEKEGNDSLVFTEDDGKKWVFYHEQDCCENVQIEDVVGDLEDLVGEELTVASEASNQEYQGRFHDYRETWTYYKFATKKGYVDVRWYGTSNGHYSERIDLKVTWDGKEVTTSDD